ncbi:MAG: serine/threonine protein kinase [Anaerolineae bacterium]|nr:serine/threonine protein kinase [Anaerolineae bacterium]
MASGLIGFVLNERYEITGQLGTGGMGIVLQAHDRLLDREVAVKLIRPEHALAPAALDAFLREARMIARLEHPNILAVHDLGAVTSESKGLPFLVMQLAKGGSLADRLKTGPLPLPEVQRIVTAVCGALDYAHRRGVVHLDVKPLNIFFDEHHNPLIGDFGLAKLLENAMKVKADTRAGTLAYMAPEQLFGSQAGPFTDVYALGITVYEMLTRALPRRSWDGAVQFEGRCRMRC